MALRKWILKSQKLYPEKTFLTNYYLQSAMRFSSGYAAYRMPIHTPLD